MSIFAPKSVSYKFYHTLFTHLSVNQLLAETGNCKLMMDMTITEYLEYLAFIAEHVTDNQKPLKQ
jgi:hypothetical protein